MQNSKRLTRERSSKPPLPPGEGGGEGCFIPAHEGIRKLYSQRGFSYAVLLIAVIVIALAAEVAVQTTAQVTRRDREEELLYRGDQYRRAIKSYYESGVGVKRYPPSLEDLLIDPRFTSRYHIRRLYPDPMDRTGKGEWKLIRAADGGIRGVTSAGEGEPLKQANFPPGMERFAGAASYSAWVFEYIPTMVRQPVKR